MYRSLLASSTNARGGPSTILLRPGKYYLPRAIVGASHSSNQLAFNRRNSVGNFQGANANRSQSTASAYPPPYEKPKNVELWEKLATKELSKSTKTVDSLRTNRVTPEGIAIQPVYYDLEDPNPSMPVSRYQTEY